jgi:hypothetical protein
MECKSILSRRNSEEAGTLLASLVAFHLGLLCPETDPFLGRHATRKPMGNSGWSATG